MTGLFVVSPFFSSPLIKRSLRFMLAFTTAVVIFPVVARLEIMIPDSIYFYLLVAGGELLIGLLIGYVTTVFFTIFQMAGSFFSMLMGLGISEVLDPLTQVQVPLVGQLQSLIAMMVFLIISGHHMLISAVTRSFSVLPVLNITDPVLVSVLTKNLLYTFSQLFFLSLKLAFPVMGTMIVLMISLALLSKAAPQMNVLMVGFPMQIAVGFISLIAVTALFATVASRLFEIMNRNILTLIHALRV